MPQRAVRWAARSLVLTSWAVTAITTSQVTGSLPPAFAGESAPVQNVAVTAAPDPPRSLKEMRETTRANTRISGNLSRIYSEAKAAAERRDWDEAVRLYNSLIAQVPNFAPAYTNRGNVFVARGDYTSAVDDYSQGLELAPAADDSWVVYLNRGGTYAALNRSDLALRDYAKALELRPAEPLILVNRARIYADLEKWDAAIADYQRAVEKKANDVEPFWLQYGLVLFQRDKAVEALSLIKRVAIKFPDEPEVRAALSVIYFDRNNLEQAESNWGLIERPKLVQSRKFLETRRWPPRAVSAMERFKTLSE